MMLGEMVAPGRGGGGRGGGGGGGCSGLCLMRCHRIEGLTGIGGLR